jgi:hypothetical protein
MPTVQTHAPTEAGSTARIKTAGQRPGNHNAPSSARQALASPRSCDRVRRACRSDEHQQLWRRRESAARAYESRGEQPAAGAACGARSPRSRRANYRRESHARISRLVGIVPVFANCAHRCLLASCKQSRPWRNLGQPARMPALTEHQQCYRRGCAAAVGGERSSGRRVADAPFRGEGFV